MDIVSTRLASFQLTDRLLLQELFCQFSLRFVQRLRARLFDLKDFDDVVAELTGDHAADLIGFERKGCLFKRFHHAPRAEEAQVSALRSGAIVRERFSDLTEVVTGVELRLASSTFFSLLSAASSPFLNFARMWLAFTCLGCSKRPLLLISGFDRLLVRSILSPHGFLIGREFGVFFKGASVHSQRGERERVRSMLKDLGSAPSSASRPT